MPKQAPSEFSEANNPFADAVNPFEKQAETRPLPRQVVEGAEREAAKNAAPGEFDEAVNPFEGAVNPFKEEATGSDLFGAGVDTTQAAFQKSAALVAEALSMPETAEKMLAAAQANELEAAKSTYDAPHGDTGWSQIKNLADPTWWKNTFAQTVPGSTPFLAGAAAGGITGLKIAGPYGGIVGAMIGGGGAAFTQEVGSAYYEYLEQAPDDEEGAVDYAIDKAGLTGIVNAASIPLGLVGRTAGPFKYALVQSLIQPAVGVTDTVSDNLMRSNLDVDQPLSQGVAESAAGELMFEGPATVATSLEATGKGIGRKIARKRGIPDPDNFTVDDLFMPDDDGGGNAAGGQGESPTANMSATMLDDGTEVDTQTGEIIPREEFAEQEDARQTAEALSQGQSVDLNESAEPDLGPVPPVDAYEDDVSTDPAPAAMPSGPQPPITPAPPPTGPVSAIAPPEQEEPPEEQPSDLDTAANEAATSPTNDLPEPTPAQIEAGNYKKGHVKVGVLDITIENPKGSMRRGTDPDGNEWERELKSHYGYVKRTEGADGDHVDVFVGPNTDSKLAYVIDQVDQDGEFDEHKVMLGYSTQGDAVRAYMENYEDGWNVGPVSTMSTNAFERWLKGGDTTLPYSKDMREKEERRRRYAETTETAVFGGPPLAPKLPDSERGNADWNRYATDRTIPVKQLVEVGDEGRSPWLLADGRVIHTSQDHLDATLTYYGETRSYGDFSRDTSAIRATFQPDNATGNYAVLLQLFGEQRLTEKQAEALRDIEDALDRPMDISVGVSPADANDVNPEYRNPVGLDAALRMYGPDATEDSSDPAVRARQEFLDRYHLRPIGKERDAIEWISDFVDEHGRDPYPSDVQEALGITEKKARQYVSEYGMSSLEAKAESSLPGFSEYIDQLRKRGQEEPSESDAADIPGGNESAGEDAESDSGESTGDREPSADEESADDEGEAQDPLQSDRGSLDDLKTAVQELKERAAKLPEVEKERNERLKIPERVGPDGQPFTPPHAGQDVIEREIERVLDDGIYQLERYGRYSIDGFDRPDDQPQPLPSYEGSTLDGLWEAYDDIKGQLDFMFEREETRGTDFVRRNAGPRDDSNRFVPYPPEDSADTDYGHIEAQKGDVDPAPFNQGHYWLHRLFEDNQVVISLMKKENKPPVLSPEEAAGTQEEWRSHAMAQRLQKAADGLRNSQRTIISLYDESGRWSAPYVDANFDVVRLDVQAGVDIEDIDMQWIFDWAGQNLGDVFGVLAACPCTVFTSANNRNWPDADKDGRTEASKALVFRTLELIEFVRPHFWVIENPRSSRIGQTFDGPRDDYYDEDGEYHPGTVTGLPRPRLAFEQYHFGDPGKKPTSLWGKFNPNLPTASLEKGTSQTDKVGGGGALAKRERAKTPEGFAYAFFMANNAIDMDPAELLGTQFTEASGAISEALKFGLSGELIYDLAGNLYEYDSGGVLPQALYDIVTGDLESDALSALPLTTIRNVESEWSAITGVELVDEEDGPPVSLSGQEEAAPGDAEPAPEATPAPESEPEADAEPEELTIDTVTNEFGPEDFRLFIKGIGRGIIAHYRFWRNDATGKISFYTNEGDDSRPLTDIELRDFLQELGPMMEQQALEQAAAAEKGARSALGRRRSILKKIRSQDVIVDPPKNMKPSDWQGTHWKTDAVVNGNYMKGAIIRKPLIPADERFGWAVGQRRGPEGNTFQYIGVSAKEDYSSRDERDRDLKKRLQPLAAWSGGKIQRAPAGTINDGTIRAHKQPIRLRDRDFVVGIKVGEVENIYERMLVGRIEDTVERQIQAGIELPDVTGEELGNANYVDDASGEAWKEQVLDLVNTLDAMDLHELADPYEEYTNKAPGTEQTRNAVLGSLRALVDRERSKANDGTATDERPDAGVVAGEPAGTVRPAGEQRPPGTGVELGGAADASGNAPADRLGDAPAGRLESDKNEVLADGSRKWPRLSGERLTYAADQASRDAHSNEAEMFFLMDEDAAFKAAYKLGVQGDLLSESDLADPRARAGYELGRYQGENRTFPYEGDRADAYAPETEAATPETLATLTIYESMEGPAGDVLVSRNARDALKDVDQRIDAVKMLVACVRGS